MSSKNENYKNYRILPDINDPVCSQYQFVYDPLSGEVRENHATLTSESQETFGEHPQVIDEETKAKIDKKLDALHKYQEEQKTTAETASMYDGGFFCDPPDRFPELKVSDDDPRVIAAIAESEALYEQEEQFGRIEELAAQAPSGQGILAAGLDIIEMLLEKNISYGNSALEPLRLFSKLGSEEGMYVRVDDKLSRLKNNQTYPGDNDIDDLIGYLILLKVARRKNG